MKNLITKLTVSFYLMIKYTIALPSTANSTNSNASDLNSVSFNPQNNHHIDAKLPKLEINQLSDKVFGINFSSC